MDFWAMISAVASAVAAFTTVWIAVLGWKTIQATRDTAVEARKASQAGLLQGLLSEWGQESMRSSLRELTSWTDSNPTSRVALPPVLEPHRRVVSTYFQKVHALRQNDLIDDRITKSAVTLHQAMFYLKIESLEAAVNPQYDATSFSFFARLYGIQRDQPALAAG